MGARFSASRTALREAYSKLSGKGLIVARPRIGTRVRLKADWNLLDPDVLAWRLSSEPEGHFVDDLFTWAEAEARFDIDNPDDWEQPDDDGDN